MKRKRDPKLWESSPKTPRTAEFQETMRVEMESCVDGLDQCMPKHDIFLRQNSASRDDAGPSHQYRGTCQDGIDPCMPKHTIFLSHSGAQKDFTEHLWKELKRVNYSPFFDKDTDSLRKGEKFYPFLEMAAENCRIAILVLSKEFFTKTKWPMMELTWFVKAQELDKSLKILPLFFEISREEMKNQDKEWPGIWEEWKRDDPRINVEEWKKALKQIPGNNGIEYGGKSEGHVAFIEKVVNAVCILSPPDVLWDTSHVQSSDQLSKPILERLAKVEPSDEYKVRVMGLYGMGGIGKTTISRVIYNQKYGEFCGKVCYIELGPDKNLKGMLKTVLRELTEWRENQERPIDEHDQLSHLMKERMHRQKVFLILDNVWDDQIDEVKKYLYAGYDADSMVLVTSRSLKILDQLGIRECDSIEMPELAEEGVVELFLFYAGIEPKEVDFKFVKSCIRDCYFQKIQGVDFIQETKNIGFHYHPLALKVLGKYFGSFKSETSNWDEKLVKLKAHKMCMLEQKHHPIFSVLRLGFDALGTKQQQIFLDLALIWKSKWNNGRFKWDWLCKIHRRKESVMEEIVNEFLRKGLLDSVYNIEELEYNIHDLYLEFAELVSQEGAFEERRFLIDKSGTDVPHELKDYPSNGKYWPSLERLIIHGSKVHSLEMANLDFCKRVQVLDLDRCENLTQVNVTGMVNLRCVVETNCLGPVRWRGLEKLSNLIIFCRTPKHTIFLSHCGAQKNFTEFLRKGLKRDNYNPFLDKAIDSLPYGGGFYATLKMAAENCHVAILVLSKEFFTYSKWPMMELTWFVNAQKSDKHLKILPLFFEISREEMKNQEMEWFGIWEQWKKVDSRINVEEWKKALKQIPGNNGIEYGGQSEGLVAFIEKVVKAVCILLPPDVLWDTSLVQSSVQLSKPILERLAKVEPSDKYKVRVMGLYGMGGIGKSTISRVIYNQKYGEFCGKVCYIELGQDKNLNGLLKIVLRELTEWREVQERPIDEHDQLSRLLKQRMHRQKVFLILDNVWDNQIDEVKMYLNAGYDGDSLVLVTSRSLKILDQLGIGESDSMEMPELAQEG